MYDKQKETYIKASLQSYTWRIVCDMWSAHQIISWIIYLRMYKLYFFTNICKKLLKKNSIAQNTFLISQKNVWPIKLECKFFGSTGEPLAFQIFNQSQWSVAWLYFAFWLVESLESWCSSAPKKLQNSVNGFVLRLFSPVKKKIIKS